MRLLDSLNALFSKGGGERPDLSLQGVEDGETSAGQVFYKIPFVLGFNKKEDRKQSHVSTGFVNGPKMELFLLVKGKTLVYTGS